MENTINFNEILIVNFDLNWFFLVVGRRFCFVYYTVKMDLKHAFRIRFSRYCQNKMYLFVSNKSMNLVKDSQSAMVLLLMLSRLTHHTCAHFHLNIGRFFSRLTFCSNHLWKSYYLPSHHYSTSFLNAPQRALLVNTKYTNQIN